MIEILFLPPLFLCVLRCLKWDSFDVLSEMVNFVGINVFLSIIYLYYRFSRVTNHIVKRVGTIISSCRSVSISSLLFRNVRRKYSVTIIFVCVMHFQKWTSFDMLSEMVNFVLVNVFNIFSCQQFTYISGLDESPIIL